MVLDPLIDLERRAMIWLRDASDAVAADAVAAGADLVPVCEARDPAADLVRRELGAAAADHDGQVHRRVGPGSVVHAPSIDAPAEAAPDVGALVERIAKLEAAVETAKLTANAAAEAKA